MGKRISQLFVLALSLLPIACASVHETYYLATFDPQTEQHNYFRINVDGWSGVAKVKFSVGFYDKKAIESLFGEQILQREYLSNDIEVFDAETGDRLADVTEQIAKAEQASRGQQIDRLRQANATVAGLIMKYEIRLDQVGKRTLFERHLEEIKVAHSDAADRLGKDKKDITDLELTQADNAVSRALVGLHAIRVAVDGDVLVRFFDGAGNEIDVASRVQIIFVANDVSRFAEAIRQLVEDEKIQADVLDVVLGQRIADAQQAAVEAASSQEQAARVSAALDVLLANIRADSTSEEQAASKEDALRQAVLDAASTLASDPIQFQSSEDIYEYLIGESQ